MMLFEVSRNYCRGMKDSKHHLVMEHLIIWPTIPITQGTKYRLNDEKSDNNPLIGSDG